MVFFRMPRAFRRFFRRQMVPRTEEEAASAKQKFAIAYALVAWNAAGFVLYQVFGKGNVHWPVDASLETKEQAEERPAYYYAKVLGIPKATVYSISGLTVSQPLNFEVDERTKAIKTLTTSEKEIFGEEFLEDILRKEQEAQSNPNNSDDS